MIRKDNSMKYVWCPQYCFCTHEGGMEDLAICRTRAIARRILKAYQKENEWMKLDGKWMKSTAWGIVKREVINE